MLLDYFFRADFRRFRKRNFVVRPRGANKPFLAVFFRAERAFHDVTDAVDHSYVDVKIVRNGYADRFAWNKVRLSRHYTFAVARLRQFVDSPFSGVFVLYGVDYESVHKSLDKGRFAASDGSDDADVNIAAGARRNIVI